MEYSITAVFLMVLFGIVCAQSNHTISGDGYQIVVLGKSKAIVIKSGATLKRIMTIKLSELVEYTEDGTTQAGKHFLKGFASTDFTFTEAKNSSMYDLKATTVSFSTTFSGEITGSMKVELFVFKESGNITVDSGEEYKVEKGAVKFNIDIENWTFCTNATCKEGNVEQTGEFLDLTLEVKGTNDNDKAPEMSKTQKGKKGTSKAKKGPKSYDMGESEIIVSSLVKRDDVWMNMTDTFPKVTQTGKKTFFTFRFEKFNQIVHYDPISQPITIPPTQKPSGSVVTKCSHLSILLAAMVYVVCRFLN